MEAEEPARILRLKSLIGSLRALLEIQRLKSLIGDSETKKPIGNLRVSGNLEVEKPYWRFRG